MQKTKRLVLTAALVFMAVAMSGCITATFEYSCPFGPVPVEVENEQIEGKLDAAPATLEHLRNIEFECKFNRAVDTKRDLLFMTIGSTVAHVLRTGILILF